MLQEKACKRGVGMTSFMESGQCLEDIADATITEQLCYQSYDQIINRIKILLERTGLYHVFIGSDVDPRLSYIRKNLGTDVRIVKKVYTHSLQLIW